MSLPLINLVLDSRGKTAKVDYSLRAREKDGEGQKSEALRDFARSRLPAGLNINFLHFLPSFSTRRKEESSGKTDPGPLNPARKQPGIRLSALSRLSSTFLRNSVFSRLFSTFFNFRRLKPAHRGILPLSHFYSRIIP